MLMVALCLADEPARTRHLHVEATYAVQAETLWPWVTDPEKLSAWNAVEISSVSAVEGDVSGVGAVREVRVPVGPFHTRNLETVLAVDAPWLFVYSVTRGGGLRYHRGEIRLVPEGDSTRLSWDIWFSSKVPGMGLVTERILRPQFDQALVDLAEML
jgi:uncharacterized protein YndB with AHSA1/START domain